mmetsp:Transcript_35600/g.81586  ORF Transcript_35600/g.81586 Transcript_35600/m.81586 type:complete len:214 (-) Transcript_35600:57-698(-)
MDESDWQQHLPDLDAIRRQAADMQIREDLIPKFVYDQIRSHTKCLMPTVIAAEKQLMEAKHRGAEAYLKNQLAAVTQRYVIEGFFLSVWYALKQLPAEEQAKLWGEEVIGWPSMSSIEKMCQQARAGPFLQEVYRQRVQDGPALEWPTSDVKLAATLLYGHLSEFVHRPASQAVYVPHDMPDEHKKLFSRLATYANRAFEQYSMEDAAAHAAL